MTQNNDVIMSKIFSSNTTFLQNLKNVALLEQKLDRGDENIPPGLRSPKKPRLNRVNDNDVDDNVDI